MSIIACIGSRELNNKQLETCRILGEWIVGHGHTLRSGNAVGADQAFQAGGNKQDPTKVQLCLPWRDMNKAAIVPGNQVINLYREENPRFAEVEELAMSCHPNWSRLNAGARKLHMRNVLIVLGEHDRPGRADMVIAWPSLKLGGGGTGQGMRVAKRTGVRLVDVSKFEKQDFHNLCLEIKQMGKDQASQSK
jgi:hypothetical protein